MSQIFSISNYFLNPYAIAHVIVAHLFLFLGIFVFLQDKKSATNLSYFLICSGGYLWLLIDAILMCCANQITAMFWARAVYVGVTLIPTSMYFFSVSWLGELEKNKKPIALIYIISAAFVILFFLTNKFVVGVHRYFFGFFSRLGLFSVLYLAFFFSISCMFFWNLIQGYRKETVQIKKNHIKRVLVAFLIGFTIGSTEFLPTYGIGLYPVGSIAVFLLASVVAHSIIRYKLLDIETVIHKTIAWLIANIALLTPFLLLGYFIKSWYAELNFLWAVTFLGALSLSYLFFIKVLQPKVDHSFQRRQYDLEEISHNFAEELVHLKGLNQLVQRIENTISNTLYLQQTNIFIYDEEGKNYRLANIKDKTQKTIELKLGGHFLQWLIKNDKIIYREFVEIDPALSGIKEEAKRYFSQTDAYVVLPMVVGEKMLGIINLGKKANLKRYNAADFNFLSVIKNQSAIAMSNSLLYKNIEEEVRQRTKELVDVQKQLVHAEKLATVGTLAGGVAHEINNPLTAILTNVQMLLTSDTVTDKLDKESLELIEEATKRCRTIVQKLMTYARKPLETTEMSKINLLDVLNSVVSFIGYQLEQDNIKLNINARKDSYIVNGNKNELEQVFTNIILNGRDAIRKIKRGGVIDISFTKTDDWIKIDVADEGEGISDAVGSKIFDPFFTTKDVGKGVGLGLSICQAILEKHKGSITFKSTVGKSTTFMIQLPRVTTGKHSVRGTAGDSRG